MLNPEEEKMKGNWLVFLALILMAGLLYSSLVSALGMPRVIKSTASESRIACEVEGIRYEISTETCQNVLKGRYDTAWEK